MGFCIMNSASHHTHHNFCLWIHKFYPFLKKKKNNPHQPATTYCLYSISMEIFIMMRMCLCMKNKAEVCFSVSMCLAVSLCVILSLMLIRMCAYPHVCLSACVLIRMCAYPHVCTGVRTRTTERCCMHASVHNREVLRACICAG
jgi:hypothetical protein